MLMGPAMLMGLSIVMLALLLPLPMVRPETAASRPRLPKVWSPVKLTALSKGARVSVPVVLKVTTAALKLTDIFYTTMAEMVLEEVLEKVLEKVLTIQVNKALKLVVLRLHFWH